MRRLLALSLLISPLAFSGAAVVVAQPALAAGSTSTAATTTPAATTPAVTTTPAISTTPSLSLGNAGAGANAVSTPQTVSIPSTTTSSGGGLSSLDALIIAIVAAFVLGGIAFWVWYDSRRSAAHIRHSHLDETMFGKRAHSGSKSPHKQRKLTPAERKRRKRGRAR